MKQTKGKRFLALLLCLCMIFAEFNSVILLAAAAPGPETVDIGVCMHHPEHTAECGYIEAVDGQPCCHEHDENCGYVESANCIHEHDDGCYALVCNHIHTEECYGDSTLLDEDASFADACSHEHDGTCFALVCAHEHSGDCGYFDGMPCTHEHDDECGYIPAVEGHPCGFYCEICSFTVDTWEWVDLFGFMRPASDYGVFVADWVLDLADVDEDMLQIVLPITISARMANGEEMLLPVAWDFENPRQYIPVVYWYDAETEAEAEAADDAFENEFEYQPDPDIFEDGSEITDEYMPPVYEYDAENEYEQSDDYAEFVDGTEYVDDEYLPSEEEAPDYGFYAEAEFDSFADEAKSTDSEVTGGYTYDPEMADYFIYTAELPDGYVFGSGRSELSVLVQMYSEDGSYDIAPMLNITPATSEPLDTALHFVVRNWHSDDSDDVLTDDSETFTVIEGYIVPNDAGHIVPGEGNIVPKYVFCDENKNITDFSKYADYIESKDYENGAITFRANPDKDAEIPEQFSGFSFSAGHDAVRYDDSNDDIVTIVYTPNVHLVKGHVFYIRDLTEVKATDEEEVFGTNGLSGGSREIDTIWAYRYIGDVGIYDDQGNLIYKKDDIVKSKSNQNKACDDIDDLPDDVSEQEVELTKFYSSSEGLHTDKTASVANFADGRTFNLDLEAWYTEGKVPLVGMVLDASGSMAFASDTPTAINIKDYGFDLNDFNGKVGRKPIVPEKTSTYPQFDKLSGYYAFDNGSLLNSISGEEALVINRQTSDGGFMFDTSPASDTPFIDSNRGLVLSSDVGIMVEKPKGESFTISYTVTKSQNDNRPHTTVEIMYVGAVGSEVAEGADNYLRVYRNNGSSADRFRADRGHLETPTQVANINRVFNSTAKNIVTMVFEKTGETAQGTTYTVTTYIYQNGTLADGGTNNPKSTTDVTLTGTDIILNPFEGRDNTNNTSVDAVSAPIYLDDLFVYDVALEPEDVASLSEKVKNGTPVFDDSENADWDGVFLTLEEVNQILDIHNTDNSMLSASGYSYFVYDPRSNTSEYTPIGYWEGKDTLPQSDKLVGWYEIIKRSEGNYRAWFLNTVKGGNPGNYDYSTADTSHFAKRVPHPTDNFIDFSESNQQTLISYEDGGYTGWGDVGLTFEEKTGLALNRSTAAFLLEEAPESDTFTLSFSLIQDGNVADDALEILYIGGLTGNKDSSDYFHVIRQSNDIIAMLGQDELFRVSGAFPSSGNVIHTVAFVFEGSKVTAYLDGEKVCAAVNLPNPLSGRYIVFDPFDDGHSEPTRVFNVDSILVYNAALSAGEVGRLTELLNKDYTGIDPDVSSTIVIAKTTSGDILGQAQNVTTEGWYYVTHSGDWKENYANPDLNTGKRLSGIANANGYTAADEANVKANSVDYIKLPKDQVGKLPGGGTGIIYYPVIDPATNPEADDKGVPIRFYIDKDGYLRCFFFTGATPSYFASYVYELSDSNYIKVETLQRALGLFVTKLGEASPMSQVSAVRFSTNKIPEKDISRLVLLDWTSDPSESSGILALTRGDGGADDYTESKIGDLSGGGTKQYNYGLTGATSTEHGLKAFELLDNELTPDADDKYQKYLIVFTDGKDTNIGDLNVTWTPGNIEGYENAYREKFATKTNGVYDFEALKLAQKYKEAGYTIFTVMLTGGPVQKGTQDYADAHVFLRELAGNKRTDDISYFKNDVNAQMAAKDEFFFSTDEYRDELYEKYGKEIVDEKMNTADILTYVFTNEILNKIVNDLDNYIVEDYIDPRFDLIARFAEEVEIAVEKNDDEKELIDDEEEIIGDEAETANDEEKPDEPKPKNKTVFIPSEDEYVIHLNADGLVVVAELRDNVQDDEVICAVYSLVDGLYYNENYLEYLADPDYDPANKYLFTTTTPRLKNINLVSGLNATDDYNEGKGFYLTLALTDETDPDAQNPRLYYDRVNKMYYLDWVGQTIPSGPIGADLLAVWNARITVRAKEDFIGGNAVLTNGNAGGNARFINGNPAGMNWVYHPGDVKGSAMKEEYDNRPYGKDASSGTGDMYKEYDTNVWNEKAEILDGYPSKGFPRTTVNVKLLPLAISEYEQVIYLGETIDPKEMINDLGNSITNFYYWKEYLERYTYAYATNSAASRNFDGLDYYDEFRTEYDRLTKEEGITKPDDLYDALYEYMLNYLLRNTNDNPLELPYAYLTNKNNTNQAGLADQQQMDVLGLLMYKWERINPDDETQIPDGGYITDRNGEPDINYGSDYVPEVTSGPYKAFEYQARDTRTVQYKLTVTYYPYPDPDGRLIHLDGEELLTEDQKLSAEKNAVKKAAQAMDEVQGALNALMDHLGDLINNIGTDTLKADMDYVISKKEALRTAMNPLIGEDNAIEDGEDGDVTKYWDNGVEAKITKLSEAINALDESAFDYSEQKIAVQDNVAACKDQLVFFENRIDYVLWCYGLVYNGDTDMYEDDPAGNKLKSRDSENSDLITDVPCIEPIGPDDGEVVPDKDAYEDPKIAVGKAQTEVTVEGKHTTYVVRGELAFEMTLDMKTLKYLFTTGSWKDKDSVTYTVNVKREYTRIKEIKGTPVLVDESEWKPDIKPLTVTIEKSDILVAFAGDPAPPAGASLYYGDSQQYRRVVFNGDGTLTYYSDSSVFDPYYYDNEGNILYRVAEEIEGVEEIVFDNNDYTRQLPIGTYTLEPAGADMNKDWDMFDVEIDYAPRKDYARDEWHFTDFPISFVSGLSGITLRKGSKYLPEGFPEGANAKNSVYYLPTTDGGYAPHEIDPNYYAYERKDLIGVVFELGTHEKDGKRVSDYLTERVGMANVKLTLKEYELPATGGPGTTALRLYGILLIAMAAALYTCLELRRRKD